MKYAEDWTWCFPLENQPPPVCQGRVHVFSWPETTARELHAEWIGKTLFSSKGKLVTSLKLWWNPPPVEHCSTPSHPDSYHCCRLLFWVPSLMWKVDFHCPHCGMKESLQLYHHMHLAVDVKSYYSLAGEYMHWRVCLGTYIAWDHQMLVEVADGVRGRFPVLHAHL